MTPPGTKGPPGDPGDRGAASGGSRPRGSPVAWLRRVVFTTPDPRRLAGFYGAVLGLAPEPEEDPIVLALGDVDLVFDRGGVAGGPITGLCFALDDVRSGLDRALGAGGQPGGPIRRDGSGLRVEVHDPEGRRFELTEPSEPVLKHLRARRHRRGPVPDLGLDPDGPKRP